MKKKILGSIFLFVAAFLFLNSRVDAIVCTYGTKSDNNAEWQKKFSFKVESYDKIYLDLSNSPEFSSVDEEVDMSDEKDYKFYKYLDSSGVDDYYKMYLSMFSSKSMYDDVKGNCVKKKQRLNKDTKDYSDECGCPSALRYHYMKESLLGSKIFHWVIYNDELDEPSINDDSLHFNDKSGEKYGILIEEREKDKKLEDIEVSECPTYTYAMERMKMTMEDNGCENNKEFDDEYTKIEEKCEALRATSTYTDSSSIPKACQKACSNLYDEVEYNIETVCGADYKGGYCGSLGNRIVNKIFRILRIIRYGIPALAIILSILDYIKALSSEDEGEMKKVNKRLMIRIIVVALLFIVPFILDFILKIFNIPGLSSSNPFCAK